MTKNDESQQKGIIGKYVEDGVPVIMKLVDELPSDEIRKHFNWLTVISWKYDGSGQNGLPAEQENSGMKNLEQAIDAIEAEGICRHAYSRTGNNLKELVYYINNRDKFLEAFNAQLAGHPRYPIEIEFYEDNEWEDFKKIRSNFSDLQD